jgi:hypothetical protein
MKTKNQIWIFTIFVSSSEILGENKEEEKKIVKIQI